MRRRFFALLVFGTLVVAACGNDDGASVRSASGCEPSGGEAISASASASASGAGAAASGSGSGASGTCAEAAGSASSASAASAGGAGACNVVDGTDASADGEATVTLDEWSVRVEQGELTAGNVRFEATNEGEDAHELVIVRGATADLPIVDGVVDEEALPEGDLIGEIEPFDGSCEATFELASGTYTVFCAIVEEEAGGVENHFDLGMRTEITVK